MVSRWSWLIVRCHCSLVRKYFACVAFDTARAEVVCTTDEAAAFKDIDCAFLVGAMPRKEGMERKDLLAANVKIFKSQGQALAANAKPDVKVSEELCGRVDSEIARSYTQVIVVGNPANTNAYICAKYAAPKIPATNITAMTRLDHNRAMAQVRICLF